MEQQQNKRPKRQEAGSNNKPQQQKKNLYAATVDKIERKDDGTIEVPAINFGKRNLQTRPAPKGVIPQTGASKDTVVYGKFNDAVTPMSELVELWNNRE